MSVAIFYLCGKFVLTKDNTTNIMKLTSEVKNNRGENLQITYKNRKIEKVCTNVRVAERKHGTEMAEKIQLRINQIKASMSVEMMIKFKIGRCHSLVGNRKDQYAVDLVHPYRLIFEKKGNEVQIANIIEIVDYHN